MGSLGTEWCLAMCPEHSVGPDMSTVPGGYWMNESHSGQGQEQVGEGHIVLFRSPEFFPPQLQSQQLHDYLSRVKAQVQRRKYSSPEFCLLLGTQA